MDHSLGTQAGSSPGLECVIFVGLPASGKTTFYTSRFARSHRHISKDLWPASARKSTRQARELHQALAAGLSVVVDNTNPAVADRAEVVAIAQAHGARVIGYHFTASTRDAVGRNRGREGKDRVPDVAIFTKAKQMVAPTRDEGFDELYAVAIAGDGAFEVTAR
ncbi:MAG: AAA family ATPase [Vicinamibacterales bacterium]